MYLRSPHTSECHFNLDWESSKSQENEKPDIYLKKKSIFYLVTSKRHKISFKLIWKDNKKI